MPRGMVQWGLLLGIALGLVLTVAEIGLIAAQIEKVNLIYEGIAWDQADAIESDRDVAIVDTTRMAVYFISVIMSLVFTYQFVRNRIADGTGFSESPGKSVGMMCVPFLQIFKIPSIYMEKAKIARDREINLASWVIIAWFVMYMTASISFRISDSMLNNEDLDSIRLGAYVQFSAFSIWTISGLTYIFILLRLFKADRAEYSIATADVFS